jgi:hypothetical protein
LLARLKGEAMAYTGVVPKGKIMEIYPDIEKLKLAVGHDFNNGENAYIVNLKNGAEELTTLRGKMDADDCMDGTTCACLDAQIGQFIKHVEML